MIGTKTITVTSSFETFQKECGNQCSFCSVSRPAVKPWIKSTWHTVVLKRLWTLLFILSLVCPIQVMPLITALEPVTKCQGNYTDCPPPPPKKKKKKKKSNRHLGIDCERTIYAIWKKEPDYETVTIFLQFSEDPIWFGQVVRKKYNMDFCKLSHMSLSSSFCHWNVCGFQRQIVFTKDVCIPFYMYAYLSITKVVPDNIKACQICKNLR